MTAGGQHTYPSPDGAASNDRTVYRADQLIDIGRAQEAYDLLRSDPAIHANADALITLSRAADKLQRYGEAYNAARAVTTIEPNRESGWLLLAVALVRMDRPWEALDPARRGLAIAPEHYGSHRIMASVLTDMGHFDEAQIHVSRTMQLDPGGTSGWIALTRLEMARQRWSDAEKSARAALAIDPESDEARVLLGVAQASAGGSRKEAAAMETLVSSLRSNPDQAHVRELIIYMAKPRIMQLPRPIVTLLIVIGIGGVLPVIWAGHILHSWHHVPADVKRLVWADRKARWQVIGMLAGSVAILVGLVVLLIVIFMDARENQCLLDCPES
jgi:tetratricopeptide (TPR) repeat protein